MPAIWCVITKVTCPLIPNQTQYRMTKTAAKRAGSFT